MVVTIVTAATIMVRGSHLRTLDTRTNTHIISSSQPRNISVEAVFAHSHLTLKTIHSPHATIDITQHEAIFSLAPYSLYTLTLCCVGGGGRSDDRGYRRSPPRDSYRSRSPPRDSYRRERSPPRDSYRRERSPRGYDNRY